MLGAEVGKMPVAACLISESLSLGSCSPESVQYLAAAGRRWSGEAAARSKPCSSVVCAEALWRVAGTPSPDLWVGSRCLRLHWHMRL